MTIFFRGLAAVPSAADASDEALLTPLSDAWYVPTDVTPAVRDRTVAWLRARNRRLRETGEPDAAPAFEPVPVYETKIETRDGKQVVCVRI